MLFAFDNNSPQIGRNSYVSETAQVIGNVLIGDNCYVGHGAILRGDYGRIEIGDGTAVEEAVVIHSPPGGQYHIGKSVTLGHGAILHGNEIGDFCVIGMGAILSIFSQTGEWTIIGEGSLVRANQKIAPRVVAVGNPVKVIRDVTAEDQELWNYGKQVYVDLALKYLDQGMTLIQ
ncbi:MAG: gamma carbonic anhydrase family protein [Desulfobacteraceae bacterium]|nr:gamma carbonic anhydrase family protein [Desulfobacteraceae bacterium]